MIVASSVVAFVVGGLLGRLYSFVALLIVSPLLAFVAALAMWKTGSTGLHAALLGLFAMALSQAGFLAGGALRLRKSSKRAPRAQEFGKSHQPSASKN